jgi:hypothetical protein
MQYLGFFLLAVFVVGLIVALTQRAKGKRLLAAPFLRTGEAASSAMAPAIGVEGQVACSEPLRGPQSGQPCVYFHYKVEQEHTSSKLTERGTETTKEWRVVGEQKQGTLFALDDGSGPVWVHAGEGVDADLQESFSGMPGTGAAGGLTGIALGALATAVSGHRMRATERILPAHGKLFAMGKLDSGRIVKQDGLTGSLVLSTKGRDGLLGATKRNQIIGLVLAGAGLAAGVPLSIFGKPPVTDECPSAGFTDLQTKACRGHISDDLGLTMSWTVVNEGDYAIDVTQPDVKFPIWPRLTLSAIGGKQLGQVTGLGKGENAKLVQHLPPGLYTINVRDDVDGYAGQFRKGGGLSFWVDIQAAPAPTAPSATATATATIANATAAPTPPLPPKSAGGAKAGLKSK